MFIGSPNVEIKSILNYYSSIIQQKGNTTQTVSAVVFSFLLLNWLAARFPFVTQNFQLTRKTMERHTGFPLIDI
jgi:hypothetical protein